MSTNNTEQPSEEMPRRIPVKGTPKNPRAPEVAAAPALDYAVNVVVPCSPSAAAPCALPPLLVPNALPSTYGTVSICAHLYSRTLLCKYRLGLSPTSAEKQTIERTMRHLNRDPAQRIDRADGRKRLHHCRTS